MDLTGDEDRPFNDLPLRSQSGFFWEQHTKKKREISEKSTSWAT